MNNKEKMQEKEFRTKWQEEVGQNLEFDENASQKYWGEIVPTLLAQNILGRYAPLIKTAEKRTEALERVRDRVGLLPREKILAIKDEEYIAEKGRDLFYYMKKFFTENDSKKPFQDAMLACHYLNKYFKIDQLKAGEKIVFDQGYLVIYDKNDKKVCNFPFVYVYEQGKQEGLKQIFLTPTEEKKPKEKKKAETKKEEAKKEPTKKEEKKSTTSDLLSEAKPAVTTPAQTPTTADSKQKNGILQAALSPKKDEEKLPENKLAEAKKERDKIYDIITSDKMKRLYAKLKASKFNFDIYFKKGESERNEPNISTFYSINYAHALKTIKADNALGTMTYFKGDGNAYTEIYRQAGTSFSVTTKRHDKIKDFENSPKNYLKQIINNLYYSMNAIKRRFASGAFADLNKIIDETI